MADLKESAQLNELYRLYGIAAHNCSNIEYRIVYLLLGPNWKQTANLNPETVVEIYDKLQRLPLGALLKEYKEHFTFRRFVAIATKGRRIGDFAQPGTVKRDCAKARSPAKSCQKALLFACLLKWGSLQGSIQSKEFD